MKQILILPIIVILISVLSFSTNDAAATGNNYDIKDQASCLSLPSGNPSWSESTCTVTSISLTISSGQTLTVEKGIIFIINGGTISNSGIIDISGILRLNSGTNPNLNVRDGMDYPIDINTSINNYGTISNSGTIINNSLYSGEYNFNPATTYSFINNYGGMISNSGTINNEFFSIISNSGTIANYGTLNNVGGNITNNIPSDATTWGLRLIYNYGTLNNEGNITNTYHSTITNKPSGTITDNYDGTIYNSGTISNSGTINNPSGSINNYVGPYKNLPGTIYNSGTISNSGTLPGGARYSNGIISNYGTTNNYGTIKNDQSGTISNYGTVNNYASIDNYCPAVFNEDGQLNGNPVIYLICEVPKPISPRAPSTYIPQIPPTHPPYLPPITSQSPTSSQQSSGSSELSSQSNTISIPSWIKNTAKWWSNGQVSDAEFIKSLQYLLSNNVITIPKTTSNVASTEQTASNIPSWVKNTVGMWATGKISDQEFLSSLQYLIGKGIITTSPVGSSGMPSSLHPISQPPKSSYAITANSPALSQSSNTSIGIASPVDIQISNHGCPPISADQNSPIPIGVKLPISSIQSGETVSGTLPRVTVTIGTNSNGVLSIGVLGINFPIQLSGTISDVRFDGVSVVGHPQSFNLGEKQQHQLDVFCK